MSSRPRIIFAVFAIISIVAVIRSASAQDGEAFQRRPRSPEDLGR